MDSWQRKKRRSATAETRPGRQLRQRVSTTTTEGAASLGPQHQTVMQTTVVETILNLMERARTIESCACEVFVTSRDSTEETSKVSRARRCQRTRKESGAAFSSHVHGPVAELNATARRSSTVSFGIMRNDVHYRSTVFRPRPPQHLQGFKPHKRPGRRVELPSLRCAVSDLGSLAEARDGRIDDVCLRCVLELRKK